MKKLLCFILCGVFMIAFGACFDGQTSDNSDSQSVVESADGAVEDKYDWIEDLKK